MSTLQELPKQPPNPFNVDFLANPSQEELRKLALEHTPHCGLTAFGSINKIARNKARMAKYTFVIDRNDQPDAFSHQTISPSEAQALIDAQSAYIRGKGKMIAIDGYVGVGPRAVPVQWNYTYEGANIAGMQQILAFPRKAVESEAQLAEPFAPSFRLFYTPEFRPDVEGGQRIIVDLDNYITYIMGPDYFGESKKGALRMLAALYYRQGALLMHAGAKKISTAEGSLTMGILGLSGTGKTTTTFSKQGKSTEPVQDDMVCIWPNAEVSVTENGCFAKTYGLTEDAEPVIFRGTCSGDAWIENVYVDADGRPQFSHSILSAADVERLRNTLIGTGAPQANVDAYIAGEKTSEQVIIDGVPLDGWDFVVWSENGRSIIPMSSVEDAADLHNLPPIHSLGILNRDEGRDAAMPGLVRFSSPAQAAGYMMLGETSKTSASGKERGKTRSPFTQPFFPLAHSLQAERFSQLAATFGTTTMWLMNTGYIGGDQADVKAGNALKVKIRHSSAMLEALLGGAIKWTIDPDFGYEIVDVDAPENAALLDCVPAEILQPRRWFMAHGREETYSSWVRTMKEGRHSFLTKYAVEPAIISAVAN